MNELTTTDLDQSLRKSLGFNDNDIKVLYEKAEGKKDSIASFIVIELACMLVNPRYVPNANNFGKNFRCRPPKPKAEEFFRGLK